MVFICFSMVFIAFSVCVISLPHGLDWFPMVFIHAFSMLSVRFSIVIISFNGSHRFFNGFHWVFNGLQWFRNGCHKLFDGFHGSFLWFSKVFAMVVIGFTLVFINVWMLSLLLTIFISFQWFSSMFVSAFQWFSFVFQCLSWFCNFVCCRKNSMEPPYLEMCCVLCTRIWFKKLCETAH